MAIKRSSGTISIPRARGTPVMWVYGQEPPAPAPVEPTVDTITFKSLLLPRGKDWPRDAPIISMVPGVERYYE